MSSRDEARKTIRGFWIWGLLLTLGLFLCMFRLLSQEWIHFEGLNSETSPYYARAPFVSSTVL